MRRQLGHGPSVGRETAKRRNGEKGQVTGFLQKASVKGGFFGGVGGRGRSSVKPFFFVGGGGW